MELAILAANVDIVRQRYEKPGGDLLPYYAFQAFLYTSDDG
jgi:hypothetical protein